MIVQRFDLNMIPEQAPVVVHCDQYDRGTGRLVISLYNGSVAYTPPSGSTAVIQGIKPDRKGFQYSTTLSGNTVTANITEQMTAKYGDVRCQIIVTETSGRVGSFAFILRVQASALPHDSDMSESEYETIAHVLDVAEYIEQYAGDVTEAVQTAITKASEASASASRAATSASNASTSESNASTSASNASTSAANASTSALKAEGYATGTQNGSAVSSGTYYHNNSKYYSDQASGSASNASTSATNANANALKSEGYALGTQNGAAVSSGTYYQNNAKYYSDQASSSASAASTSATSASGYASNASQSASNAGDSATEAATSATNAHTSEINAASSETNATTSATAAATYASNANSSATQAQGYATNAATSASNASDSADDALGYASTASGSAEDSEAWATGQRDGVDVPTTDPAYHNNAKYYAGKSNGGALTGLEDVAIQNIKNGQFIEYDSTEQKFVNKMVKTILTGTLTAGQSSITFTNAAITATSRFNAYVENAYIELENVVIGTNTLTLVFPEQDQNINVKVVLIED